MAQGNYANWDYFIDCPRISQSALRAIFGVWVHICIAVIALCIRSIFRSQIQKRITLGPQGGVSLWHVSPSVTPSEAFEMRGILAKALIKRDFAFVFVSTFCIVTAVVGAASTVISNHAVGSNTVVRDAIVQGRLVTNHYFSLIDALIEIKAKVEALNGANAPLDELLDFAPPDDSQWIYKPSQWNNTWKGNCSFAKHEAVELVVYPTNSTTYQDEVPHLGDYIPSWATVDQSKQAVYYAGFFITDETNYTGAWRDMVVTYVFGSTPVGYVGLPEGNMNLSIVNYLAHHIARDERGNSNFLESKFRSDIHTAECQFIRAVGVNYTDHNQSGADGGFYLDAVAGIGGLYNSAVVNASIAELPIRQPTGKEMLRYWQAYTSVKDAQYPHPVARVLSVNQEVVQIRLSFLVITIGLFLFANLAAALVRMTNIRNGVWGIHLPSSQLDWIVQAAREHIQYHAGPEKFTPRDHLPTSFASRNQDLSFIVTPDLESRIAIVHELSDAK